MSKHLRCSTRSFLERQRIAILSSYRLPSKDSGISLARLRDAPGEWSSQYAMLGFG
jgi:hypothetical protein